jgi:hypothetical protein
MTFGDADVSTPAFASVNTNWTSTGATSASFTPPAGSLVRLAVFGDTSSGANPGNETVTDSAAGATGWTFKIRRAKPDSGSQAGCVALWEKYYAASPGAITVTVIGNATGANAGGFSTKVVAGCTGTAGHVEGSNTAAVMSIVETTVNANCRVEFAGTDWNVQAAPTAGASQTAVLSSGVGAGPDTRVYVGIQNAVTATPGTAVTMSTASPSAGNANNFIAWELVPASGTNLSVGNDALSVAAAAVTVSASLAAGNDAVAAAANAVTLNARPAVGNAAATVVGNAATVAASLAAGNAAAAVGAFSATVTSGSSLAVGNAVATVAANAAGLSASLAAGNGAVGAAAGAVGLSSNLPVGPGALAVGAYDVTITVAGASSLAVEGAIIGVGAYDVQLTGGVVATVPGSWQGLADILNEFRQVTAEQLSMPPVACPQCGEPLETARRVLHCKYDGWRTDLVSV